MSDEQTSQNDERWEIHFSGRVQGVGFRYTTRQIAARYPITGFVQNLSDGRVLLVVEGSGEGLTQFVGALNEEMDRYIDGKQVAVCPASHEFSGFEVRR